VFLAEPPPTQYDLHFRFAGTPVRIHPFFWVTTLILGLSGGGRTPPAEILGWVVAVMVSILIHEFGHAIVQRRYGGHPRIILYGFGGLAVCNDCDRSTKSQILISLAGPVAGFLFAAVVLVAIRVVGHQAGIHWGSNVPLEALGLESARVMRIVGMSFYWEPFPSENVDHLIGDLLWINGLWGLVNLLPIYPLDGGHVSRELCLLGRPRQGLILSLQISMVAAGAMVLVGLSWRSLLVPIFFAYLAYSSYRTLEAYRASPW
jgi:membrane-associated protease RseP (regulator of RpoE activity)